MHLLIGGEEFGAKNIPMRQRNKIMIVIGGTLKNKECGAGYGTGVIPKWQSGSVTSGQPVILMSVEI
jgi:hypothetical protein